MPKTTPVIRIRGIRQKLPPGYLIGRNPGQGKGSAQLISVQSLLQRQQQLGTPSTPSSNGPALVAAWLFGRP